MSTYENDDKVREDEYLKGRDNYFNWLKYFNDFCTIEGFFTNPDADGNFTYVSTAASVKSKKKWLHKRIGNGPGRKFFDPSKTIPEIFLKLNHEFGSGYADPDALIDAIKGEIYFDSRRDPQIVLSWLDDNLKAVNSALSSKTPNQELADDDYRLIIIKGLENVSAKTNFWQLPYGEMKKMKRDLKTQTPTEIRKLLIDHWHDHSSPEVLLKQPVGQRITPLRQNDVPSGANNANGKDSGGRNNQRHCQNCSKKVNGRMKFQIS